MAVIKRERHKKKGLEWFFNELRKAAKDINYNAYNPAYDPFIGRNVCIPLRSQMEG